MWKMQADRWKRRLGERAFFEPSLRFEPFLALNTLLDPDARVHEAWRRRVIDALPPEFFDRAALIGAAEIWPVLPSTLPDDLAFPTFEQVIAGLRARADSDFQERVLRGLLHSPGDAAAIVAGRSTLRAAIGRAPAAKREWLGFIGLFPYDESAPLVAAIERLIAEPAAFRDSICRMLDLFWEAEFARLWSRLAPAYRASAARCRALFATLPLAEFSREMLLRVEVDEVGGRLDAIRGGYSLELERIEACHFMPSAFNDRRYWSALDRASGGTIVYFPHFDPALTLAEGSQPDFSAPPLDAALLFKALGDSTRLAILSLLARKPSPAVELARRLDVSKATISHHVHLLEEAGLLEARREEGVLLLSVRREALERLSDLAIGRLFGDKRLKLTKTRTR